MLKAENNFGVSDISPINRKVLALNVITHMQDKDEKQCVLVNAVTTTVPKSDRSECAHLDEIVVSAAAFH